MRVCVQGLWHLGSVTAACLASVGHSVVGLDFDEARVRDLQKGIPPVGEPGLVELMAAGAGSGNLLFSADIESSVRGIDLLWVAYDTPVDDDDVADSEFVLSQIERVLVHLPTATLVLVSSQLPVGSIARLEGIARARAADKQLRFACAPENLRLGRALQVFLQPDRVIVGVRADGDREIVTRLFEPITACIEWMSVESAEMTKHAINAFLATSVAFANELAAICEVVGADAKAVERGMKTESRIGAKAYVSPGAAFAGGTLARDVRFLNETAASSRLNLPLLASVKTSNDEHRRWAERKLRTYFPALQGKKIALWGLTYKAGTDTLRRSMAVELCRWLIEQGAQVRAHDPAASALPAPLFAQVGRTSQPLDAIRGADALVICTEWPMYRDIPAREFAGRSADLVVLDANRFRVDLSSAAGVCYVAVGTPDRRGEPA